MDNADAFGSSTAPLTWHDFLERMRQPSAADFVKSIKSFIVSFSNNPPDPERDSAAVQEFLHNMEAAFRAHSLWASCSEEELESAGEGLEKYVMTKLFPRVFASVPNDVKVDDELHEKMSLIQQFIRPENLDIQPMFQNETSWLLAQKELQKINMYKAPRDKLLCILNCCKVINNLLHNASIASNENPPGADEFLPVLIFVTIKANPPQLHSNLLYIQRYRRQSRLVAETAYFFTNILSAESFIFNIDANALSMDEAEFHNNMESARALLSGLSAESDDTSNQSDKNLIAGAEPTEPTHKTFTTNTHQEPTLQSQFSVGSSEVKLGNKEDASRKDQQTISNVLSTSDLENIGASMLMMEDQVSQIFQDFPYLFSQAGDLTVSDVDELLENYKKLVFRYVCLSKGMGISTPKPPFSDSHLQARLKDENAKESEDTGAEESNLEMAKDIDPTDDDSNGVSLPEVEKSGSKTVLDEAFESQNVVND